MVRINVKITITTEYQEWERFSKKDNHKVYGNTEIKKFKYSDIQISVDRCSWGCSCNYADTIVDDKVLHRIETLINKDKYPKDEIVRKINSLIENNKYIRIQKILDEDDQDSYGKLYDIQRIISDNNTNDTFYSSESSSSEEDGPIIKYPYVTNFTNTDNIYEANLHIPDNAFEDRIYITVHESENSFCCHSPATIDHTLPVQLSASYPSKAEEKFEYFTRYYIFKDSYGEYKLEHLW